MEKVNKVSTFFRQNRVFGLYLVLLATLNIGYVLIEIYKAKISKPLLLKTEITQAEFMKLETLSTYALYCESVIIVLMIVSILLVLRKRNNSFLKTFIATHLFFLVTFLLLGNALSWIFIAPVGNLTQQLVYPIILILGVLIYFIIKRSFKGVSLSY